MLIPLRRLAQSFAIRKYLTSFYPAAGSGAQGTVQNVTTSTSSSAQVTNPFGTKTRQILLTASTNTWILIGNGSLTASATVGTLLGAGFPYYFKVNLGESIAALAQSSAGVLSVTELAT